MQHGYEVVVTDMHVLDWMTYGGGRRDGGDGWRLYMRAFVYNNNWITQDVKAA
jgi:hypothetical protein